MLRRVYDWVLGWADHRYGGLALLLLAFAESSVFPIPPDVLLMALALGKPGAAFRFALICSVGSVAGGLAGYLIGWLLMDGLGRPIIELYNARAAYAEVEQRFVAHGGWAVAIAGFTPIPYKVFTIAAGATQLSLSSFVLASVVSRSARFFLISGLIYYYGPTIKVFIDKYFNILTIVFTVLVLLGFVLLGWYG
ncbi:MAG: DedA family protein [Desulfurellaceae bacterium]|nr:DedA family protein [Desulfurellaceae bacterium]